MAIGAFMMGLNRRNDEKEEVWCGDGYEGGHAWPCMEVGIRDGYVCMRMDG